MEVLALSLCIVAVVLVAVLTVVVYTIRKYLLNIKKQKKDAKHKMKKDLFPPSRNPSSESTETFQIPITTMPVKQQIPLSHLPRRSIVLNKGNRVNSTPDLNTSYKDRCSSQGSLTQTEKEDKIAVDLPVTLLPDVTQPLLFNRTRRISQGMMHVLANKGRTVSTGDLRQPSLEEEVFLQILSPGYSFSDDGSSIHSANTEVYDSPSTDNKRKRMGNRRKYSDSGITPALKKTYKKSGKVTFTTRYIDNEKMLELHILRAFDLAPKRNAAEMYPFVCVYLMPGKKQRKQTKPLKHTNEPFVNEKIMFTDIDDSNIDKYRLKVKVYNHGRFLKRELLGEVDMALGTIDTSTKETFNLDLYLRRSESSLASVCVSICHQATFNKLEVIVQEAKHLPKIGISGFPNAYASVQLYKDQGIERKETAIKRNTRDPVFKESLEFDISCDSSQPLSSFSLSVSIHHHAVVGRDQVLGHILFSLGSPQKTAETHWRTLNETPHKHIEFWHSLLDPDEL